MEVAKEKAEQQNYFSVIALAQSKMDDSLYDQAQAMLWATPKELRNWEWGHAMQLCRSELLTLKGHEQYVYSVAFSPDGKRVVTGSNDNTAKIWDAVDWNITREEFPQYQLKRYQAWLKRNEAKKNTPAPPKK